MKLARIIDAKTGRCSSYDQTGRNSDRWTIEAGETKVLADIRGPGAITHIWMTQACHYRECLLKITWDNAKSPSVLVPLGDFFCLGHGIVNSFVNKEIKVTIEHGHGNHMANEMSSVAYWYAGKPTLVVQPPPVEKRMPVLRDNQRRWLFDRKNQCPGKRIKLNAEMKKMKAAWARKQKK